MRVLVSIVLLSLSMLSAHADCGRVGPNDTYSQLNVILECQEQRIKALEQNQGAAKGASTSIGISAPAETVWSAGKCFPYGKEQPFKVTISVEMTGSPVQLCWKDGTVMATVLGIGIFDGHNPIGLFLADPSGKGLQGTSYNKLCKFNQSCTVESYEDVRVAMRPEMLAGGETRKMARLHIENRPR